MNAPLTQLELEQIPRRPVLDRPLLGSSTVPSGPATLPYRWSMPSGRTALAAALRNGGLKKGDTVLLPAYHCTAMVEPIHWLGLEPVFVPIAENLALDLKVIKDHAKSARALIVIHYFGFPQPNIMDLRRVCDQHGLLLVEDCAHCYYGMTTETECGHVADYAVTSAKKFFSIYDGGELFSKTPLPAAKVDRPGPLAEVKALVNILDRSRKYTRWPWLHRILYPIRLAQGIAWSALKRFKRPASSDPSPASSSDGGQQFNAGDMDVKMTRVSRWLIDHSDHEGSAQRRRNNYQHLLTRFSHLSGCRPLLPMLPETTVPYMFPLYIGDIEKIFPAIKSAGVPIERFGEQLWTGVTADVCPISIDYSRHVLQLPCHQGLRDAEIAWMVDCVTTELKK